VEAFDEFGDGLRLIARRLELADQLKLGNHSSILLLGYRFSHRHEWTQLLQGLVADAGDVAQLIDRLERLSLSCRDDAAG
jgi:hypothetical protein